MRGVGWYAWGMSNRTLWLVKDNNELVSHCECKDAMSGWFPQADCPWCGCGWLFSCMSCNKSFTFARVAWIDMSIQVLATRMCWTPNKRGPAQEEVLEALEFMKWAMEDLREGDRVVVLDYELLKVDEEGPIEFDGVFAHHELECVPQVRALKDPSYLERTIGRKQYWLERELEDLEGDEE